jgi:SAM-dependent methyltransferase
MGMFNTYEDAVRAAAYAGLEFPGTYYLAYRDLPEIIFEHVRGKKALDFGCGAGRSTRFLQKHGFDAVGVDISAAMIKKAKEIDPGGDYRIIEDGCFDGFKDNACDLILSAFTFDNIPTMGKKFKILKAMGRLLKGDGRIVNMVSSPEIYLNEWASFSTKDFPENRHAKSGDIVKIIQTDTEDKRPVEDVICTDEDYRDLFKRAGLGLVRVYKPLAKDDEPYSWVNETRIPPWVIYVLEKSYPWTLTIDH